MNLWADFDNQQTQTTSARHKPTRRLTEQSVVSSVRQWLLQDYVSSYGRTLGAMRIYRRCYWVDAWGIDRHSHSPSLQSAADTDKSRQENAHQTMPAILQPILSLSQQLAQGSRPIAL